MTLLTHLALTLAVLMASLPSSAEAFTITSPSASLYWVSGETNVLNWKADAGDPEVFDVQLLNDDQKSLNGNFQVGNALQTHLGTAQLQIIKIPPGQYKVLFTNSSKYEKDNPQVYYTSGTFSVKPHGTSPSAATPVASVGDSPTGASGSPSPTVTSGTPPSATGKMNTASTPAPSVDNPTNASGSNKSGSSSDVNATSGVSGRDGLIQMAGVEMAMIALVAGGILVLG